MRLALALLLPTSLMTATPAGAAGLLPDMPTTARAADGSYISWREHRIDDEGLGDIALRGGDGLQIGDLDGDGHPDIVSVHESDDVYDGTPEGYVRLAFGSADPDQWTLGTLAQGTDAAAAEDSAIGDLNGDGYPDVVVACELAHLIYLQNPGKNIRTTPWKHLIPPQTENRGSFIRVYLADLNGDGRPEIITANKGAQDPTKSAQEPKAISWFDVTGDPLDAASWTEHVLTRVPWPINARPVDLDGDGDIDIIGGSVAQHRVMWFENSGGPSPSFTEHEIAIDADWPEGVKPAWVNAFNMDFADLNGDGRLDIVTFDTTGLIGRDMVWLEQPATADGTWTMHMIGGYGPDSIVGIALADIDGDGDQDVMTGGYSLGSRLEEESITVTTPLGRLAWFENPGDPADLWTRHDFSRRKRGMFDQFRPRDMDGDGDVDFVSTRGNSGPYDGVFWLEQVRTKEPAPVFKSAWTNGSQEMPLPK